LVLVVLASLPLPAAARDAPQPVSPSAAAQATEGPGTEVVTVRLKDGGTLRARVIDKDDERLKVVTVGGLALDIPRSTIAGIDEGGVNAAPRPSDSNYTRLFFSTTGRPLRKGEGYFSDHYVVFPGVAYGLTDNISVGGGLSVVPGLGLSEQLYYGSARAGKQFSERVAVSGGALIARGGDGDTETLGLGFVMATLGKPDRSLTVGAGVARTVSEEYYTTYAGGEWRGDFRNQASYTPVVMFGGTARVSPRVALVSENWLILNHDFKLSEQPFAVGVRFLGDRLTADVGVVLIGEMLREGFPVPWLSVTYHFGQSRLGGC
jgi:hypothetical protein